jgi:hypothetical protein
MSRAPLITSIVLTMLLVAAPPGQAKVRKKPVQQGNTPVLVTVLDGSTATLDLGDGTVRTAPLGGTVRGVIAGGYSLGRDNAITLRSAHVTVGSVALVGDGCDTAPAATSLLTAVGLAPGAKPKAMIYRTGVVSVAAPVVLRTVLDVRPGACGTPSVATGYADTPLTLRAAGKIMRGTGLTRLTLESPPAPLTVQGCLAPGAPATACSTTPVAVPVTLTTHLEVGVRIA